MNSQDQSEAFQKPGMTMQPCPKCGVYLVPMPVSDRVYESCMADYSCDGCIAFREHTNPYV